MSSDPGVDQQTANHPFSQERRPLSRMEVIRALRISNIEAVTATVHASLTGGAFQTGFALFLGAGSFWMGVIGAIPTFAALVQVFSSLWVERLGERKRLTAWFSLVSRSLWLAILVIPWVVPRHLWLYAFVVLFGLASVAIQVPVPAFTSWLSDLVPADHRGRYFGRRNMLAGLTSLVASLPTAWILDHAITEMGVGRAQAFAVLFAVAVVFGVVGFFLLLRQPEPPMAINAEVQRQNLVQTPSLYRRPLQDPTFRKLLAFGGLFAVGQFFAAPFYTVYALEDLHLSYTWLQLLGGVASLAALLSMPLWGYLSDRFGNKPLLTLAVVGVSLTPLPWLACNPDHRATTLVILIANNLFGGVVWGGVGLLQFNMLIETTPSEGRSLYVGALSAASGIAGGLAPVVGGAMVEVLRSTSMPWGMASAGAYHVLFATNSALRLLTLPMLQSIPAAARATPREVLERLGAVRVRTLRQIRQLQHAGSEEVRQQAVAALSEARSGLAVQELVLALSDPALGVRRSAAVALGEIGDPAAVPALRAILHQPESGIVREAADALGRLGAAEAIQDLGAVALEGERSDRVAAIRSLGRIGSPAAEPYLLEVLRTARAAEQEDVLEAVLQALGQCRIEAALHEIIELLKDRKRSVRLAAIQALGDIGDPSAGHALEGLLADESDPAVVTRVCVALAQCGHVEAVPSMYDKMAALPSAVARRQVANAIAALLGDEETYRLLTADPMDREGAVVRRILTLGRKRRKEGTLAAKKRELLIRRASHLFTNGDLQGAANLILRAMPCHDGPACSLISLARTRLRERKPTEEEFLAALAAAAVAAKQQGFEI